MKKPLLYGVLASFFFAFTFLLNRSINLEGGYWMWTASLRYLWTLPILFIVLLFQKKIAPVVQAIQKKPLQWLCWSTVGFGLFYAPLVFASTFSAAWLVAATWQITIVAGVLLTPLFHQKIPVANLFWSLVILVGVFILQFENTSALPLHLLVGGFACVLMAAFCYPLGNRKMMALCGDSLTTLQRVFGMTLCSMPFWTIFSILAFAKSGPPSNSQLTQSFLVALFSGVVATLLFFKATDLVRANPKQLAVVEATQVGEILFTLLGGLLFLHDPFPSVHSVVGLIIIVFGMACNSLLTTR